MKAQPQKTTLLKIEHLTLGYDDNLVIKNLDLEIQAGDFLCIIGANGSGKSTLVRAILGLIKPKKGRIQYLGGLKRNFVGYLPQFGVTNQFFPASVREVVLSGTLNRLGWRPFYGSAEKKLVKQVLQDLKINHLAQKNFGDLSGGQRQKVLLARGLCATTQLLILDEPSNSLDFDSKTELYKLLQKLNREQGLTIVLVTHDLDSKSLIGNKILALDAEKPFFGKVADFLKQNHGVHYD